MGGRFPVGGSQPFPEKFLFCKFLVGNDILDITISENLAGERGINHWSQDLNVFFRGSNPIHGNIIRISWDRKLDDDIRI